MLTPVSPDELAAVVREHSRVLAVGGRTKPRLSAAADGVTMISTRALSGMPGYDPGEFTFTAMAGTPLRDIRAALAERGQYLPFDPPLVDAGATIGGTVASGLSGPGRFRYGGLRDFILAVRFVDGKGQLLRGGAKVVKNAAGFDLPKFFVGSLGRFGVIVELSFKVFPAPPASLTLRVQCATAREAADRLAHGAAARWELDALDYLPGEKCLYARLGGPAESNAALAREIQRTWAGAAILAESEADAVWNALREFAWSHADGVLAKIPIALATLAALADAIATIPGARTQISAGGSVAFVSLPAAEQAPPLDAELRALGLPALVLRGTGAPARLGISHEAAIVEDARAVFDPVRRFAPLT